MGVIAMDRFHNGSLNIKVKFIYENKYMKNNMTPYCIERNKIILTQ